MLVCVACACLRIVSVRFGMPVHVLQSCSRVTCQCRFTCCRAARGAGADEPERLIVSGTTSYEEIGNINSSRRTDSTASRQVGRQTTRASRIQQLYLFLLPFKSQSRALLHCRLYNKKMYEPSHGLQSSPAQFQPNLMGVQTSLITR